MTRAPDSLWHLFLNRGSSAAACAFPLNLLLVALAALASYGLVEQPIRTPALDRLRGRGT
jgi:peptidoglycan/LPS O-acetylase OafA/YrhL